jgi:hypothetical protein
VVAAVIQLAFYRGRARLFDRLIQWWTRGPYSHVEVVTHRSNSGAAWCISSSWMDGGVRGKWMVLNPARWDVIVLPDIDSAVAHRWLAQHAGSGYDWAGLLGFVWRPVAGDARRWFCSEAGADICGLLEPWRFNPNDLAAVAFALAGGGHFVAGLQSQQHPGAPA